MKKLKIISIILAIAVVSVFAVSCASPVTDSVYSEIDSKDMTVSPQATGPTDGNEYLEITENPFVKASEHPSSMFSLSVSTAAYSNLRRYVNSGYKINKNQINIEQIVNYFS